MNFSQKITERGKEKTTIFFEEADKVIETHLCKEDSILRNKIDANGYIKREYISEAYIEESFNNKTYKRPVVDLVQQGGGMYGIALLGYTYVMEKLGIRFYSHGGASAGGINALLVAAISKNIYKEESVFVKEEESPRQMLKSEYLTNIIANTNFSSFMDRDGLTGRLQKWALKNLSSLAILVACFSLLILLSIYGFFGLIFNVKNGLSSTEIRVYDFVVGTLNVIGLFIFIYILLVKILKNNFGINQGRVFYRWADRHLKDMGVNSTGELEKVMKEVEVFYKNEKENSSKLVLISSDLTHNRIVKLPEEASIYWANYKNIKPAAYLRATMSIPFVFKVFVPNLRHYYKKQSLNKVRIEARFVDGGMLSNFPIREFHSSRGSMPRFPTFGVLLSERKKLKVTLNTNKSYRLKEISLIKYIGTYVTTFRDFYDNDFLNRNKEISVRTVTVNTKGYNWLNFWMSTDEKINLFKEGVNAAIQQLEKFDWEEYKKIRDDK